MTRRSPYEDRATIGGANAQVPDGFRWSFGDRDGKRSTTTTYADDSALRECHEFRGTRYSERHSSPQ
jgi:hypothetical protein